MAANLSGGGGNSPSFAPQGLFTPFGNVTSGKGSTGISATNTPLINTLGTQIGDASNLNDFFSGGNLQNNPLYQAQLTAQQLPIQEQQQAAQRSLSNNLNANNQLGSSNGDYQQYLLNQQYGNEMNQAQSNALNNSYADQLAALQGLGNVQNQQYNAAFAPLQALSGYQNALNGLTQQQVQYQQNQNNLLGSLNGAAGQFGSSLAGLGLAAFT